MTKRILGAWSVGFALTAAASAQTPAGSEFPANTFTAGAQRAPAVAREPDGDMVVVWHSLDQDGDGYGIFGQRYDADGTPRGVEFRVNTYTTGRQYLPWVEADGRGRFVVVWTTYNAAADGDGASVHGQRFTADGSRLGDEFIVNTYTTGDQSWARVSVNRLGDFVVVWQSEQVAPGETEIIGQRFDRTGRRVGGEFGINSFVPGGQASPDVRVSNTGSFLVVWSAPDGSDSGIFGRAFDPQGLPIQGAFRVNLNITDSQNYPSLDRKRTLDPTLVIAWQSRGQDGSDYGVFARRYISGVPQGPEFQVNTHTTGYQGGRPVVATDEGGNFVVTWRTAAAQDGSDDGVMARRFFASGVPRSPEFVVNSYTTGFQDTPNVGADLAGNFTISWRSLGQDGSDSGVFAQRYGGLQPRTLRVDTASGPAQDGNGVLEPQEAVDVRPSWQNLNGATQAFTGGLGVASGPAGCTQSTVDGLASYGTVANGATAECTDCYTVSATAPRCVQHWDARALETLAPDTQGQAKDWMLHVGDSFGDVPRASGFYPFIETILHHNVTGGCSVTPSLYCPSNPTTREQMAVFVLVAKEGAGYGPPACTTPVFNDVPASNPFCRWIEELARRGVVSGCGSGNYCPAASVSREQMAVFVLRVLDPTLQPPACTTPVFADVPASSGFCRWIEELFRRGVVTGCGGGNYCPTSPVTREQMSVFLAVTFGLTLYGL